LQKRVFLYARVLISLIHTYNYADYAACLQFAKMPKMSPRTNHIGLTYHWLTGKVSSLYIEIRGVSSNDHLADQFTKGLCHKKLDLCRGCELCSVFEREIEEKEL